MVEEWTPPTPRPPARGSRDKAAGKKPEEPAGPSRSKVLFDRIRPDLPMVALGVVFFVLAVITFSHGPLIGSRIYPFWALCIALGAIATSGGLVSMYVGPDLPSLGPDEVDLEEFVLVPRNQWKSMQAEFSRMRAALGQRSGGAGGEAEELGLPLGDHDSVLSELEELTGTRAPAPTMAARATRTSAVAAAAGPMAPPLPESPGAKPILPPSRQLPRRTEIPASPVDVEVPQAEEVPAEQLRAALDAHMEDLVKSIPPGSAIAPSPVAPKPEGALPPVPISPTQEGPSPQPVAPAPPTVPPESYEEEPAPAESYSEDEEPLSSAPTPEHDEGKESIDADLAEIEDLAKRFGAIAQPIGIHEAAPSEEQKPTGPTKLEPEGEPAAPPTPPTLMPGLDAPPYEWELSALRVAFDHAIDRHDGEPVGAFLVRAEAELREQPTQPPPPISETRRARAFVDTILDARRTLSEQDLSRLSQEFRERAGQLGRAVGVSLRPNESLTLYAVRLREVLEAADERRATPTSSSVAPEGRLTTAAGPDSGARKEPQGGAPPAEAEAAPAPLPSPEELDRELERMVQDIAESALPAGSPASPEEKTKKKGKKPSSPS